MRLKRKHVAVSLPLLLGFAILAGGALKMTGCGDGLPNRIVGSSAAVPQSYFGMHIHSSLTTTPWPEIPLGSLRLWDTQTTWAHLEPAKGEWQFDKLDRLVDLAAQHHIDVLLTLGQTPSWASSNPKVASVEEPGRAAPPKDIQDWRDYIRTIATRYRGRIHAYEIWNEPNLAEYYTGDVSSMVLLTGEAAKIIHAIDDQAVVVAPSPTSAEGVKWLRAFLLAGGDEFVDVQGYHFYVTPDAPEKIIILAQSVRSAMADYNVKRPLWDTETGWSEPKQFKSDQEASAYVARSALLVWAAGIERFYWYAWDNRNWVTLEMTDRTTSQANSNGLAYQAIQVWMLGKRVDGCARNGDGTWNCHLVDDVSEAYIFWNPSRRATFAFPKVPTPGGNGIWTVIDLTGQTVEREGATTEADVDPKLAQFQPH